MLLRLLRASAHLLNGCSRTATRWRKSARCIRDCFETTFERRVSHAVSYRPVSSNFLPCKFFAKSDCQSNARMLVESRNAQLQSPAFEFSREVPEAHTTSYPPAVAHSVRTHPEILS